MALSDLELYAREVKNQRVALMYGMAAAQASVEMLGEWAKRYAPESDDDGG